MDDLVTKARDFASRDTACGRWINALADALEAEIRSRENWQATAAAAQEALEAERQLRAKWEIEAQDLRDRAVQLESWVAQARPVIEAVREWQRARLSVLSSGVDDYASRVSDFGTAQKIMTIALPPKETP